ncbi:MAG: beta-N-acetylhexosaminidase [Proteobacteria bacterium]|nr:beta-N-acetylhexosaminidase [Pseudomonadota bacterium]
MHTAHAPAFIDIAGPALTVADRRRLAHPMTGGLILFARHWQSRAQITRLVAEAKAIRPDLLVAIDHEGGRVQRFREDGFTPLPAMRALGEAWLKDALAATQAATAVGYVLAAELRACGIDLAFTPVLDLDHGSSSVIGDRAFARDPRVVTLLAKSLMHGLLLAGMANCGKHFPGHGRAKADSHVAVPVDTRAKRTLLADDARPYAWLDGALASVMPAHVIYPKVDARPAGFSSRWLQEVLRGELGFAGAIVSDDLSMAGARVIEGRTVSPTEAALAALSAGCDLVLLCNQSLEDGGRPVDDFLDGLAAQWPGDAASEARRLALLPQIDPLPWDELMHEARYVRALETLGVL